jgi:hypothetical protein
VTRTLLFHFLAGIAGALAPLGVSTAAAEVLEITPGGDVLVRVGGGDVLWQAHSGAIEQLPRTSKISAASSLPSIPPEVPRAFIAPLAAAAHAHGLPTRLLASLVWQESRWNHQAVSPKGAVGLTQLMPGTARDLGVDPRDPVANLHAGARYLRQQLDTFGRVELALAAYNAGPNRVRRAGGIPPIRETQQYVAAVIRRAGLGAP